MNAREGFTLLEVLVCLALSAVLVGSAGLLLTHHLAALAHSTATVERIDAIRTIQGVLRTELEAGKPGEDWRVVGDTVFLRAFRGTGIPCGSVDGEVDRIWIRGDRRPDPRKDSVLVVDHEGNSHGAALSDVLQAWETTDSADDPPCGPPSMAAMGWIQHWNRSWGPSGVDTSSPILVRIFERGSYHLADGALRYRAGRGGRQPLTPELLDDEGSALNWVESDQALRVVLRFRSGPESTGNAATLAGRSTPFDSVSTRIQGAPGW